MMKYLVPVLLLAVTLQVAAARVPPNNAKSKVAASKSKIHNPRPKLPSEIKLILEVGELPGGNDPKSFWEVGYDIRIADWQTVVNLTKSGADVLSSGVSLQQSSFAHRSLLQPENRRLVVTIPVKGALLERLRQQEQNPQAFALRSTVRLYDARLDRNFAFKVDRVWEFKLYPEGEANITIKIKPDGAFSVWGPVPRTLPQGYTIVGSPPGKTP